MTLEHGRIIYMTTNNEGGTPFTDCFLELILVSALVLALICYPYYLNVVFGPQGRLLGRPIQELVNGVLVETSRGRVRVFTTLGTCSVGHENDSNNGVSSSSPPIKDLVVLIHGYAGTCDVWFRSGTIDSLIGMGMDVLTFDLFGHGFSDSPDSTFGADLFANQIVELLFKFGFCTDPTAPRRRLHLMAHSMGASPCLLFAHTYPDLVDRVVFLSPAITEKKLDWKLRIALRLPYLREFFAALIIPSFANEGGNKGNSGMLRACYRLLETQLASGGSWIEPRMGLREGELLRALRNKPVLLLWGLADDVIPLDATAKAILALHLAEEAEFQTHVTAGHMSFADGDQVMKDFFQNHITTFLTRKMGVKRMSDWNIGHDIDDNARTALLA